MKDQLFKTSGLPRIAEACRKEQLSKHLFSQCICKPQFLENCYSHSWRKSFELLGLWRPQRLLRGAAKKIACVNEFRDVNKKQTEKISLLVSAGLCNSALGFQNNRLPNSQIKASSSYPGLYPYRARLRQNSAWCARHNNHNQYLRIDLRRVTMVTGIATQGRHNVNYWVTQYWLLYSQDNVHWALYRQMSNDKVRKCSP